MLSIAGETSAEANAAQHVSDLQGSDAAGAFGSVQLVSQRTAGKGVYEEWARYTLHVDVEHAPETVHVKADDGTAVSGSRYRLQVRC